MKKFLFFYFFVFLFFSCSKSIEQSNPEAASSTPSDVTVSPINIDVTVKDGILHFPTTDAFTEATISLSEANLASIQQWEKQIGFRSSGNIFESLQLLTNEDQPADPQVIAQLLQDVSTIRANNSGDYSLLTPYRFSFVLDKEGLVYIGNSLLKFTENGQYLILDGNLSTLREVELTGVTKEGKSYFVKNPSDDVVSRSCGYEPPVSALNNATNDRRSELFHKKIFSVPEAGTNYNTLKRIYYVEIQGWSKKKNWVGNWKTYNGDGHILEYNFSVDIHNEYALNLLGVNTSTLNRTHIGSRTANNAAGVIHYTSIGFIDNIPAYAMSYADPFYASITLGRHTHQGMLGAWNEFTCPD